MKEKIRKVLPEKVTDALREWVWRVMSPRWVTNSGVEIFVKSPAEWVIYNDIFVDCEYDKAIDLALSSSSEQPLILDIGANVGFFSLRVLDRWKSMEGRTPPKIIGFEGSPPVYEELVERTNQLSLPDLSEYHMGLIGKRNGKGRIYTSRFHAVNSVAKNIGYIGKYDVDYLDINDYIQDGKEVYLLKCDIEGSEYDFVREYEDLILRTRNMIVELHEVNGEELDVEERLLNMGFTSSEEVRSGEETRVLMLHE